MKPKISLCLITGNCEDYIERCLTSFAPIADEIVLVRAIGNQTHDKTLEIATEVCASLSIPLITGEYKNAPGHESWPHVDNFAAARQMSFDLATGDFCFWVDTDDVLESGAELIREHAAKGTHDCYIFPYNIFGRGVQVPRERMIRKGAGQWRYPVHECFTFNAVPVQAVEDQRCIVKHLPHLTKSGSNQRNLTILKSIPEEEMTAGLWYHLQGELAGTGDTAGSIAAAEKALACPDIGQPERFELFLNLARLSTDPNVKATLLHQAHQADPRRRESLGLLVCNALDYGRNDLALAYSRQMMALPKPNDQEWNERNAAYTWLGADIHQQALRMNGFRVEAENLRRETLVAHGGPTIALLHATRGRPQKAAIAKKLWLDLAANPGAVEHIFVLDADDEESAPLRRMHHLTIPAGGGCVAAWNHARLATTAPILVQLSDDWIPCAEWDKKIIERIGDTTKEKVLAISDGHRTDELLCMFICTRAYTDQDGFLFHPSFLGVYSDNWATEQAYARKAVIEARDIVFTHNHPAFKGGDKIGLVPEGEWDTTYLKQNSPERYAHGLSVIEHLRSGQDWSSVPGFFSYLTWYDYVTKWVKDGDTIVEIGVWFGRSIIYLAQTLRRLGKNNVKIFAVDGFTGELNQPAHDQARADHNGNFRAAFEANLKTCGVDDMITIIESDSALAAAQFADRSVAFAYVDAAHDYESVKRDIVAWLPKITENGILSGHDADWHEVRKAVDELIEAPAILGNVWVKMFKS